MTQKQLNKLDIINKTIAGFITMPEAAAALGLSERQIQRLIADRSFFSLTATCSSFVSGDRRLVAKSILDIHCLRTDRLDGYRPTIPKKVISNHDVLVTQELRARRRGRNFIARKNSLCFRPSWFPIGLSRKLPLLFRRPTRRAWPCRFGYAMLFTKRCKSLGEVPVYGCLTKRKGDLTVALKAG